jgi:hypothetical protein
MNDINFANDGAPDTGLIFEFTDFRIRDEHRRRVIESLDRRTLFGVVEIWLESVTPGAFVIEQHGMSALTIVFPNRAAIVGEAGDHHVAVGFNGLPEIG